MRVPDMFRSRWFLLSSGTLALSFSNGATANIVAAWIAPFLLLGFAMATRPLWGIAALSLAGTVAAFFTLRGVIPVADAEFVVACVISGVLGALPYAFHRMLAPALGAVGGTLVFPAVAVALLYVLSLGGPFGTWGVDGYVQAGFLPLLQLASVAGVWGVTFLVYWFASALQGLLRPGASWAAPAMFGAVLVVVALFAGWRMLGGTAPAAQAQVAAITTPAGLPDRFFDGCAGRDDQACRTAGARKRIDALFERSAVAAQAGAELIVWPEAAAQYDAPLEPEFIEHAQDFARRHEIYLVAGVARIPADRQALIDNKAMVFDPTGALAFEYHKAIPVPGERIVAGDGRIRTVDTPFGRLAVVICFDADFPMLVRRARQQGAEVLAIPANDWRAITPLHGQMARFRAVENGFTVVRATSNGLSLIANPFGAVLAESDSFASPGAIIAARLSLPPRPTVYTRVGDAFALACVVFVIALLLVVPFAALMRRRRTRASLAR